MDLYDWGYDCRTGIDWLSFTEADLPARFRSQPYSVFMNPPFSLACAFVDKARELGARKIVCFQRFAWWEGSFDLGKQRGRWWTGNPPNRIYVCGDRADCWLFTVPPEDRKSGTPSAHAWFVWERGHPPGPVAGHIWKDRRP